MQLGGGTNGVATPPRGGVRLGALVPCLALALVLSGCATYSDSFAPIQGALASQQYDVALKDIDKQSKSKKDHVLYLLNKGMVLRMKRDFAGSNQALEAAKQEMDRLYAASVSENAMSFLINDATVSYGGEDYEQVLVHLYMALNYLELSQEDEARVEAQQVDVTLRELSSKFLGSSKYTRDAFSLYLSGMIYEDLREWSDAMISYRQAYDAYKAYPPEFGMPVPDMLKHDLLRMAQHEGLTSEAARYSKEFNIPLAVDAPGAGAPATGQLVFILNNGLAPIKREKVGTFLGPAPSTVTSGAAAAPVYVTIALPYYESPPDNVADFRIDAGGMPVSGEPVENIDAIARASLDSHMAAITARSIARAVTKASIQEAVDRAGQNGNRNAEAVALLGSIAVRIAAIATEHADTRSWLTLPAEIRMTRLALPPGQYTIKVELLGTDGNVVATREYPGVTISAGRRTYLTQHWTPPLVHSPGRR